MTDSLATGQRSFGDPEVRYDLEPPLTAGCPETSTDDVQYPLEVTYDYDAVDPALFDAPPEPGLERWAPLLPPLAGPGLGAGATPLLERPGLADWAGVDALHVKDESRNPTWSQKDRLNRLTVSAAVRAGDRGVVASSTGNHGASAAAHAAAAGLDAVVVTNPDTPPSMQGFLQAYGTAVLRVEGWDDRAAVVDDLSGRGFHPVTSRTRFHTGHPYGPEGYKTIAYELHHRLGGVPGSVFVPTAHAELLYGVWKGFRELRELGVADGAPTMVACEPAGQAALVTARERGDPAVEIDAGPSEAHSIGGDRSTVRGYRALERSDGYAVAVPDETTAAAREALATGGLWQEFAGAAGLAGVRVAVEADRPVPEPVVALACSSGFKDADGTEVPLVDGGTAGVRAALAKHYDLSV